MAAISLDIKPINITIYRRVFDPTLQEHTLKEQEVVEVVSHTQSMFSIILKEESSE